MSSEALQSIFNKQTKAEAELKSLKERLDAASGDPELELLLQERVALQQHKAALLQKEAALEQWKAALQQMQELLIQLQAEPPTRDGNHTYANLAEDWVFGLPYAGHSGQALHSEPFHHIGEDQVKKAQ